MHRVNRDAGVLADPSQNTMHPHVTGASPKRLDARSVHCCKAAFDLARHGGPKDAVQEPQVAMVHGKAPELCERPVHTPDFAQRIQRKQVAWLRLVRVPDYPPRPRPRGATISIDGFLEKALQCRAPTSEQLDQGEGAYHFPIETTNLPLQRHRFEKWTVLRFVGRQIPVASAGNRHARTTVVYLQGAFVLQMDEQLGQRAVADPKGQHRSNFRRFGGKGAFGGEADMVAQFALEPKQTTCYDNDTR